MNQPRETPNGELKISTLKGTTVKHVEREVKSASAVVAKVTTPQYDTLQEAIDTEGEKKVLELFNLQNSTNIMNAARAAATNVPSKKKLGDQLFDEVLSGKFDNDPEFTEAKADATRLSAWREKKVEEMLAAAKAAIKVPKKEDSEENGDE